ncbi:MAG: GtrA family protein [Clostridia bacterium]|nr:GtrA family protein [Clostridia bacterium]
MSERGAIAKLTAFISGEKTIDQFIKYVAVGLSSFVLEYAFFYFLFIILSINELISNTTAITIVFFYNFLMNRLWSFKSKEKFGKQVIMYGGLFFFNMLMSNLFIYSTTEYLKISPLISKVLIMGLIVLWNFVIYKKIIYKR